MSPSKHKYQGLSPHPSSHDEEHINSTACFSSDRPSGTSSHEKSLDISSPPSNSGTIHLGSIYEDKDPFTSPQAQARPEQKLSATASAFLPFNFRLNNQAAMHSSVPSNAHNIGPDSATSNELKSGDNHVMDPKSPTNILNTGTTQLGTFSTDTRVTRALRISGIYMPVSREQVENCLQVSVYIFSYA